MKFSINTSHKADSTLSYLFDKLPIFLKNELLSYIKKSDNCVINEIRIKKNSNIYLIVNGKNTKTDIYIDSSDIENIFEFICQGSLYAHVGTIKEGYIPLGCGIRAGICGTAVLEDYQIVGIRDISSINIRIPQKIKNASSYVYSILENSDFSSSILIYSAPGVGKTSILRDLVLKLSLSRENLRFSVIDTRDEIITENIFNSNCDIFKSYPKGQAIELATKSMTPQIIICDEISNENEANSILKAVNSGVTLVATAHASSFEEITNKNILIPLFNNKVFKYLIGVSRKTEEKKYSYTLNLINNEEK